MEVYIFSLGMEKNNIISPHLMRYLFKWLAPERQAEGSSLTREQIFGFFSSFVAIVEHHIIELLQLVDSQEHKCRQGRYLANKLSKNGAILFVNVPATMEEVSAHFYQMFTERVDSPIIISD
ncbi:6862_t:CDS:2 [Acaulospora colombiana]|uniref:6862_t:CDS:1 n=1 Tax=Acaulospora colombiana TaxID=27376 RepID=A0ACA9M5P1_9GLOM|nr:6862_t:CDS:2 [Acaulospora colombiana]